MVRIHSFERNLLVVNWFINHVEHRKYVPRQKVLFNFSKIFSFVFIFIVLLCLSMFVEGVYRNYYSLVDYYRDCLEEKKNNSLFRWFGARCTDKVSIWNVSNYLIKKNK